MAFDFPTTPANGDEFTPVGGPTYVFVSPTWQIKTDKSAGDLYVKKAGDTMSGSLTVGLGGGNFKVDIPAGNPSFQAVTADAAGIPFLQLTNPGAAWQMRNDGAGGDLQVQVTGSERLRIRKSDGQANFVGSIVIAPPTNASMNINAANDTSYATLAFNKGSPAAVKGQIFLNANAASDMYIAMFDDVPAQRHMMMFNRLSGVVNLPQGLLGFPAIQNPSVAANILDDYEEGSWVPSLRFGAANTGIVVSSALGRYTKVGGIVHFAGQLALSSKGTAVGNANMIGLPFSASGNLSHHGNSSMPYSFVTPAQITTALVQGNSQTINLYQLGSGALTNANFLDNTTLYFGGTYEAI